MCILCTSDVCPTYKLLEQVTLQGMTFDELLVACREEEERWKDASAAIVVLHKARTRWANTYTDMFEGGDNTEETMEAARRAENVPKDSEEELLLGTVGIGNADWDVEEEYVRILDRWRTLRQNRLRKEAQQDDLKCDIGTYKRLIAAKADNDRQRN
ncbi:hypothetical protein BD626DRAFT_575671 [Schizophyllum amplum]|uniref:Uncharacterized protein n=1 Tax=Schizophyllum amplum TaxID=97359 RepID=A0A550BVI5_9AGAR|nr:hypothetical protein BD626DRAFT_575671 [Auriculariopsis ampla]